MAALVWLACAVLWPLRHGQPLTAELTAWRFAFAMRGVDTTALGTLAASGSAHNLKCARHFWAATYFRPQLYRRWVEYAGEHRGRIAYRIYGEPKVAGEPAVYEIWMARHRPRRIESINVVSGPMSAPGLSACIAQRRAS